MWWQDVVLSESVGAVELIYGHPQTCPGGVLLGRVSPVNKKSVNDIFLAAEDVQSAANLESHTTRHSTGKSAGDRVYTAVVLLRSSAGFHHLRLMWSDAQQS